MVVPLLVIIACHAFLPAASVPVQRALVQPANRLTTFMVLIQHAFHYALIQLSLPIQLRHASHAHHHARHVSLIKPAHHVKITTTWIVMENVLIFVVMAGLESMGLALNAKPHAQSALVMWLIVLPALASFMPMRVSVLETVLNKSQYLTMITWSAWTVLLLAKPVWTWPQHAHHAGMAQTFTTINAYKHAQIPPTHKPKHACLARNPV